MHFQHISESSQIYIYIIRIVQNVLEQLVFCGHYPGQPLHLYCPNDVKYELLYHDHSYYSIRNLNKPVSLPFVRYKCVEHASLSSPLSDVRVLAIPLCFLPVSDLRVLVMPVFLPCIRSKCADHLYL